MFSDKLIGILKSDPVVTVLTGAGISAESGVPTFRGENGLWKKFKPEELADFDSFIRNPELVWEWYRYRQKLILEVKPNPGHYALSVMEEAFSEFNLITQNVDNLHYLAGSKNPIELHGNILRNRCLGCGETLFEIKLPEDAKIPGCETCGGMLRPDVVWFGEELPEKAIFDAERAIEKTKLFFSIGTSALVYPAASMPLWAKNNGAYLVEINIERTQLSDYSDEFICGKSGEILPRLVEAIKSNTKRMSFENI